MAASIPVIDLAPALAGTAANRRAIGQEIDRNCRDIGFFSIVGHGVPLDLMRELRALSHEFFSLPLEEKLRAQHPEITTPRGYRAQGLEALSYASETMAPPDLKEFYHIGREGWPNEPYYTQGEGPRYFIPNLWPARPASYGAVASRYYEAMERLAAQLLGIAALGLGIPEDFFADKIDRHITAMRVNYYAAQTVPPEPGQLRAGVHSDYGLLTVLNGEDAPGGLQVKTRGGEWIDVATDPATFVINIGDLMMRWTNDRWVSNPHRVANPPAEVAATASRVSIAFFHHPNYDATIECIAPPGEAKYPPVGSGEYRDFKYAQTTVAA